MKTKAPATQRRSSVGLKYVMAGSGVILIGYIVAHMIGNLKIFFGGDSFNAYAEWLRNLGAPLLPYEGLLWIIRIVLLVALIAHVSSAIVLTRRAHAARPVKYAHRPPVRGSYAARTMRWGGLIIFLYVIFHILDLTTRHVNPVEEHSDVNAAVIATFAPDRWWVTLIYIAAVLMLGAHLRHGLWSAIQTAGLSSARTQQTLQRASTLFAIIIVVGFLSVPTAVILGLVS
ncbi:succinate dehydrogenase cytochrome b subunit [Natronoglycomyces albus]|uniref:Succinate dehydrogenase cytochrome b subunit n=1 Tax=Natronoglycomyces albus TaxID=2811108 RepID=A0A895XTL0_9ACTN|nr:succinate dehydrogenase cytochrome b subunit [Natronoglycomyces albus]QSB06823.1 succinate dehydrogenase cytochrome b subunit [Natronoglycomyces albus]